MASFNQKNQLMIFILFVFNQFNQQIASSTLTLKSSNSHLNLNQIIYTHGFNRSTLALSFKYKPFNDQFVLISGILDLQSEDSETNQLLKFTLIINKHNELKLIIDKLNKSSRDNLLVNYFELKLNKTQTIKNVNTMKNDAQAKEINGEKVKKLIDNDSINKISIEHRGQEMHNSAFKDEIRFEKNETNKKSKYENNNWHSISIMIIGKLFEVNHMKSCNKQLNCLQQNLVYKLIDRANQYVEVNQLLIGREWFKSDLSLLNVVGLINRPGKHSSNEQNDSIKQLSETEDSHSNSQIHDNFIQNSSSFQQKSNQEYSGLIGCLTKIHLNGHHLDYSTLGPLTPHDNDVSLAVKQSVSFNVSTIMSSSEQVIPFENSFSIANTQQTNISSSEVNMRRQKLSMRTDRLDKIAFKVDSSEDDARVQKNDQTHSDNKKGSSIGESEVFEKKRHKKTAQDLINEIEDAEQSPIGRQANISIDWWNNVDLLNNSLIGRIERGICDQSDPCLNFCRRNASCMLNEDGQPICHCDRIGYTGERCFFPLYKKNCKELELLGFRTNGQYIVDSDGIGANPPSHVYCKFKAKEDTKTLIYHNLKDETVVRTDQSVRPFQFKLKYRDFTQEMLVKYMQKFKACKQEIRFDCHQAKFGFGDYAWFRKLSLNNTLSIVDRMPNDTKDEHSPNQACTLMEGVWNYEQITVNEPIVEAYFLPLSDSCSTMHRQCDRPSFWNRLINTFWPNTKSITQIPRQQLKARAGKRKHKSEARLTISPLECTGFKSHEVAFSTEASYIEIYFKDLIDKKAKNFVETKTDSYISLKQISFHFRTLQTRPGILLHITLRPNDQLYFEIMLKNELELELAYPQNGKMRSVKLRSIQRLNTGDWQLLQVLYNENEMRVSVNTISILFFFDGKSMFDKFKHSVFVGGVPRTIGNKKSKIGFIGCFRELSLGDDQIINLKEFIHPKLIKQILPTCKRICTKSPCENKGVCIEHWSFRRCVCKNKFSHMGFNCELNLNKNSITILTGKPYIHLFLNRNFNKFLHNELNEFINQNTINTLIDMNAKSLAEKGKLKTDSESLDQVSVKGVKNLHKSEEKRWNELLLMNNSFIWNQTFGRLVEQQPARLGLDKWELVDKGKLKMTLQLEFRTRIDAGLLFYANDNLNNFIQLHFMDKQRICLTFNALEKIVRIEIILEDGILSSGEPIQLRIKRYLKYTVFHVLIYLREHNKYEQKSIYVKIPLQFLSTYSHRPFTQSTGFDYYYKLEPELTFKFVNFNDENGNLTENENEDDEVTLVDTLNNNEIIDKKEASTPNLRSNFSEEQVIHNLTEKTAFIGQKNAANKINQNLPISNLIINSPKERQNNSSNSNRNKFTEQVIPVRGYYKQQVFPSQMIEMTDNAETYDGLINNLDKIVEDENEFLKPLNLIFLANLNNFDSYFGLNKTFNTSTTSLTKNIVQSITNNVLQNNKTKDYAPLLTLLNTTISKINLTKGLNDSLGNSLQATLKIGLEKGLDKNNTLLKQLNATQPDILLNLTISSTLPNDTLIAKNEEKMNMTSSFSSKNYTQIYIGNVDNNGTLSSLPPFVGAISGVIFNNQLINLTKMTEKRYKYELENGEILKGIKMLCTIKDCQNAGKCLDDWKVNKTSCDCTNTSYAGDTCTDDLGSAFNSFNHLFYRLDSKKPRNLLEDQVTFELTFNFNPEEYFIEKNRYYHQEIEESNLHKHNNKLFNLEEQTKDRWYFDNRILLLIIYETRYILFYVNKDNSLILSDVDNKGNELSLKIESHQNNSFLDEYRHYVRYNRNLRSVWLDQTQFQVNFYRDVVKHWYLPNGINYGIYIGGKPKRDKRFNNYDGFSGNICNVKVVLNGQTFEPFNSAFNAVNMSFIQIKGNIRQARCAAFKNKLENKENSLPYRKKELLNFVWNTPEPEFESSLFTSEETDSVILYLVGFVILIACILVPVSIYVFLLTIHMRSQIQRISFNATKQKRGKKSKSLDSIYQGEIRLMTLK